MRILIRFLGACAVVAVLLLAGLGGWFYFSNSGLPDVSELGVYSPAVAGVARSTSCLEELSVSSPADLKPALPALFAAEGLPTATLLEDVGMSNGHEQHGHYADQIARGEVCSSPSQHLKRTLKEIRTALQIRRKFGPEQQTTIFLNTVYFGDDQRGITAASQHYFGITPQQLSTTQSALLAGLISRPNYYSPTKHPDRALARRNKVLEAMKAQGSLSASDTVATEATPLGTR